MQFAKRVVKRERLGLIRRHARSSNEASSVTHDPFDFITNGVCK